MGGAQAGEVASRLAAESFETVQRGERVTRGLPAGDREDGQRAHPPARPGRRPRARAWGRRSPPRWSRATRSSFAHVGDSRAYLFRDGELKLLTSDHSLVEELRRQGRLTDEQAEDHPQRSIITRALGPEREVEVDTMTYRARPGDVYLLCSDGLTTMVKEDRIAETLRRLAPPSTRRSSRLVARGQRGGRAGTTSPSSPSGSTTPRRRSRADEQRDPRRARGRGGRARPPRGRGRGRSGAGAAWARTGGRHARRRCRPAAAAQLAAAHRQGRSPWSSSPLASRRRLFGACARSTSSGRTPAAAWPCTADCPTTSRSTSSSTRRSTRRRSRSARSRRIAATAPPTTPSASTTTPSSLLQDLQAAAERRTGRQQAAANKGQGGGQQPSGGAQGTKPGGGGGKQPGGGERQRQQGGGSGASGGGSNSKSGGSG